MPAYKMTRKKTQALPAGVDDKNRFRVVFIPTYERWVGMQANPWVIPDATAVKVLQTIWDAIYVDAPYTVTAGDVVFERVCTFFLSHVFVSDYMARSPNVSANGAAPSNVRLTSCLNSFSSMRRTVKYSRTTSSVRSGRKTSLWGLSSFGQWQKR